MSLARLTAIVRTRYETGSYGDAVFRMATSTWERLKAQYPPPQPTPQTSPYWFPADPVAGLLGIPFVLDDDLPDGIWQLAVRDAGGMWLVIESGTVGDEAGGGA